MKRVITVGSLLALAFSGRRISGPGAATSSPAPSQAPLIDDTMEAGEGDSPRRRMVGFNEFEGPFGSIRFGGGFLYDFAAYEPGCKQQGAVPGSLA